MKVLVVYAHPNPKSFNHAILEEFTRGLTDGGHTYDVVDLYNVDFDPCFRGPDFAQFIGGQMPEDVQEQQKKVADADAMVFICPIWTWHYPAILKGWFDRVFSMGFAYKFGEKGPEGLLKHKKVLILTTTMGMEERYKQFGIEDAINTLDRITWGFCGIQDVKHIFLYQAATDSEARKKHLEIAYHVGREF